MVFGRARVLGGHTGGAERKQAGKRDRRRKGGSEVGGGSGQCRKRPGVLAAAGSLALQQHHLSLRAELYNVE